MSFVVEEEWPWIASGRPSKDDGFIREAFQRGSLSQKRASGRERETTTSDRAGDPTTRILGWSFGDFLEGK